MPVERINIAPPPPADPPGYTPLYDSALYGDPIPAWKLWCALWIITDVLMAGGALVRVVLR